MTDGAGVLTARIHRGSAGLESLRARWEGLQIELKPQRYFHAWNWYSAWLRALADRPDEVLFVAVERAERLLAVVPLQPERRKGLLRQLRVLQLPAHGHLPLADVVCHPDLEARTLIAAVRAALRAERVRWDMLEFYNVMDESVLARAAAQGVGGTMQEQVKTCDYIACDIAWEDYAAGLSANFRSNLNKARNKLNRETAVTFELARTAEELRAMMPDFLEIEASGWKGAAHTAILNSPPLVAFYAHLLEAFGQRGALVLSRLRVDGHTIAAEFCLADNATLYVVKLAYDESAARLAPGNSLLERMFRALPAQLGLRYINLVGSPPWFANWNPARIPVWCVRVYSRSPAAQLELWARRARARIAGRAHGAAAAAPQPGRG